MDEDEARAMLFKYYNDKNNSQIKNIYSLIALFIGVMISYPLYLTDFWNINIVELALLFVTPFMYFLMRSRHWASLSWRVIRVKKKIKHFSNEAPYEDNILAQLDRACNEQVRESSFITITFRNKPYGFVKFKLLDHLFIKWLLLLVFPIIIYFIIILWHAFT